MKPFDFMIHRSMIMWFLVVTNILAFADYEENNEILSPVEPNISVFLEEEEDNNDFAVGPIFDEDPNKFQSSYLGLRNRKSVIEDEAHRYDGASVQTRYVVDPVTSSPTTTTKQPTDSPTDEGRVIPKDSSETPEEHEAEKELTSPADKEMAEKQEEQITKEINAAYDNLQTNFTYNLQDSNATENANATKYIETFLDKLSEEISLDFEYLHEVVKSRPFTMMKRHPKKLDVIVRHDIDLITIHSLSPRFHKFIDNPKSILGELNLMETLGYSEVTFKYITKKKKKAKRRDSDNGMMGAIMMVYLKWPDPDASSTTAKTTSTTTNTIANATRRDDDLVLEEILNGEHREEVDNHLTVEESDHSGAATKFANIGNVEKKGALTNDDDITHATAAVHNLSQLFEDDMYKWKKQAAEKKKRKLRSDRRHALKQRNEMKN